MTIFVTEKSINGLLSALYYSFTEKIRPDKVFECGVYQPLLGADIINIPLFPTHIERVKNALFRYGGTDVIYYIKACLLSCEESALFVAFNYAYLTLEQRKNMQGNLAEPCVAEFEYTVQKVLNERHRAHGFLRFKENANGILYAPFSPDNDITELVAPHFFQRLGKIPFVIHDLKRNRIAISDGFSLKFGYTDKPAILDLSENEKDVEALFKKYYNSVNIKERKNKRQQNSYMPIRYRKFMPETYEID